MIHFDKVLELLHTAMAYMANFMKGGTELMFDLIVSVMVIVLIWEGIGYLRRH